MVYLSLDAVYGLRFTEIADLMDELEPQVRTWVERGLLALGAVAALLAARSLLRLIRGLADLFVTRTIEGTVLRRRRRGGEPQVYEQQPMGTKIWRMLQRSNSSRHSSFDSDGNWHPPRQPRYRWYLAIDDGESEEIDAWQVRQQVYESCRQHQRVRVRVSPRLGYVRSLEALVPAAPGAEDTTGAPPPPPPPEAAPAPGSPAAALLAAAQNLAATHTSPFIED